jgi:P27 family predicted phage terminase small subunit
MPAGRPPKPTSLKKLAGNPGKRPLNKNEPKTGEFLEEPPDHLDKVAVEYWHFFVPRLKRMGTLADVDFLNLAIVCQAYSTLARAQKQLRKLGISMKTYQLRGQLSREVKTQTEIIRKYSPGFGLDAIARSRISVPPEKNKNKFARLAAETETAQDRAALPN